MHKRSVSDASLSSTTVASAAAAAVTTTTTTAADARDGETDHAEDLGGATYQTPAVDRVHTGELSEDGSRRPQIMGIFPSCGSFSGDVPVVIRGINLGKNVGDLVALSVAGVDCLSSVWMVSPSVIKCVLGPGIGSGPVRLVTLSGGEAVSTVKFTYVMCAQSDKEDCASAGGRHSVVRAYARAH